MKKVLIILRGIPGCGKTTFAEIISPKDNICTADDYHMFGGVYIWKPENIHGAHNRCKIKAEKLMKDGETPVVIANTNTTENELLPYVEMGKKYGYQVFSIIVENRHGGVNTHDVPEETINKMKQRFNIKL